MNDPAVLVLLLEQGDRSLEDHTEDWVSRQTDTRPGQLPLLVLSSWTEHLYTSAVVRVGPRESLAAFVEWVLVSCGSLLTVDIMDDDTIPTPDPEPSPPSPRFTERQPEPIATHEPSQEGATELGIAPEP